MIFRDNAPPILAMVSLMLWLSAGMAVADAKSVPDGDDSPGRFDVERADASHDEEGLERFGVLRHEIVMYDEWDGTDLEYGSNMILISFDLNNDGNAERTLSVEANSDGSLYGVMRGPTRTSSYLRGYARAWRDDTRSVTLAFPRRLLRKGLERYRWRVFTDYADPGYEDCPGNIDKDVYRNCLDHAPDRGWVRHKLQ